MTLFFFLMIRPPPISTLFPYTTLFRSARIQSLEMKYTVQRYGQIAAREGRTDAAVGRYDRGGQDGQVVDAVHCEHSKDRKSTRLNSSHLVISYAVFCLKKKKQHSA